MKAVSAFPIFSGEKIPKNPGCLIWERFILEWILFFDVYQSINYIGSRPKQVNPEAVHAIFAGNPVLQHQKN